MLSEKPKTQRLSKKKPQEEVLKLAKLKQKIKPQPEPKKPRTVAKTTAPMKKRMKPIRGQMVEASQTAKPMSPKMRTDVATKSTTGRVTSTDVFEKRKKEKNQAMIRKMKPLRIQ